MKKIGLFCGANATKTSQIAKKIVNLLGENKVDIVSIEDAWKKDFEKYDNIIVGASTWFDGELPTYWDELRPELETLEMKGKKVAIFGLGDQARYPDNFVDGIGILVEVFESVGAKIVGTTSSEGYTFNRSQALRDEQFLGLALDFENQSGKTDERVTNWVKQLEKEFS